MPNSLKYFSIILTISFCSLQTLSQNIDSLLIALKAEKQDTTKLNILFQLVENINDEKIWPKYNEDAYNLSEKLLQSNNAIIKKTAKKGLADALNNSGYMYNTHGNISMALDCYSKSIKIQEEINDQNGLASTYNNIGLIYQGQNEFSKALEYLNKSIRIYQTSPHLKNNKAFIATLSNNIAGIYKDMGNVPMALDIYIKSLKLYEESTDKRGRAYALINIGSIYRDKGDVLKGFDFFKRSLSLLKECNDKLGYANTLANIALVYMELGNIEKTASNKQKNYSLAIAYADSSLRLSKEIGFPEHIRNAEQTLKNIHIASGNYKEAFKHYKEYIIYRDSINNESTRKASIKNQLNYEFEKKEAVIKEQQQKERAITNEQSRIQKIIIASVLVGFLLVVVFALFIFRTLKLTKHQKHIIEEKQKEILDSIRYAKRIQTSLLPSEKYLNKNLQKISKK